MTATSYTFEANETFDPFGDAGTLTAHHEYGISMDGTSDSGTFGGGTITIERYIPELASWAFAASATETSAIRLAVGIRSKFRATLSGAASPSIKFAYWPIQ